MKKIEIKKFNIKRPGVYIPVILISGTIIYLIINRLIKKDALNDIEAALKEGKGKYGSPADLVNDPGLDINFWKRSGCTNANAFFKVEAAKEYARKLKDAIGYWSSDEEAVIALLKKIGTKNKLSEVAYYYNALYTKDLFESLMSIDNIFAGSIIGWFTNAGQTDMYKVQEIIEAMPKC